MEKEILEHSIPKLFAKFVIPSVIGMLVNAMYIIVDGIFIGNGVGELGLASVNIDYPVICLNMALAMLFGVGASILISIKLGQGKRDEAEKILGTSVFMMIVVSILITIIGLIFIEPIMIFLGAEGEVLPLTIDYSTIIYIFTIFHVLASGLNPIIRADGNPKQAMIVLVLGALLNVVLDWLFVMKFNFGIKGAAAATVIGMTVSGAYLLYYFLGGKSKHISLRKKYFRPNLRLIKLICVSGFVSCGVQLSLGLVTFMQNNLLLKFGTVLDVSVFAIVGYISVMSAQCLLGVAEGIQPIIGYNFGAGNNDRVKKTLRLAIIVDIVFGGIAFFIFMFFSENIVSIFNHNPEIIRLSSERLLMYLGGVPVVGMVYTYANYYQATKRNLYANLICMGRSFIYLVPATFILPFVLGVKGIFIAPAVSDYLAFSTAMIVLVIEKRKECKIEDNTELEIC